VRRNLIQRRTLIVSRQISKIFNSVELENLPYLDSLQAGEGSRFFRARFLISKRALMSGKPTWGEGEE